jgi:hypothetical protein
MPAQDTSKIKEKIITTFRNKGPSLPVHIAKEVEMSILFTSAFLSELIGEKQIKISNMRVGSSPVYYLPGQESSLENYSEHLRSKEKEAYLLLKEKKFLKDKELEPAIRVAIREIKDFAIPLRLNEEIWWRYFTADESEIQKTPEAKEIPKEEINEKEIEEPENKKELNIFEEKSVEEKPKKKTSSKRAKPGEKFLEKVKEFLLKSSVEIISIEGLKKEELVLKVRINGEEQILVAFNKKKIGEKEILKASKTASEFGLKYSVFSMGELPKKMSDLITALKNIKDIGKVE